jgi:hypothetical protein
MEIIRQQSEAAAAARQLLASSADAHPATKAELWDLLVRYRRALADLVAAWELGAWPRPGGPSGCVPKGEMPRKQRRIELVFVDVSYRRFG